MFIEVYIQDALTKIPGCKNLTNQTVTKECEVTLAIYGDDLIYTRSVNATESTASFTFKVSEDLSTDVYLI